MSLEPHQRWLGDQEALALVLERIVPHVVSGEWSEHPVQSTLLLP